MNDIEAINQLRNELYKVLDRYAQEADMSMLMIIGLLDSIKADHLDALKKNSKDNDN